MYFIISSAGVNGRTQVEVSSRREGGLLGIVHWALAIEANSPTPCPALLLPSPYLLQDHILQNPSRSDSKLHGAWYFDDDNVSCGKAASLSAILYSLPASQELALQKNVYGVPTTIA